MRVLHHVAAFMTRYSHGADRVGIIHRLRQIYCIGPRIEMIGKRSLDRPLIWLYFWKFPVTFACANATRSIAGIRIMKVGSIIGYNIFLSPSGRRLYEHAMANA